MDENEFNAKREDAINQLYQMANQPRPMPPTPPFVRVQGNPSASPQHRHTQTSTQRAQSQVATHSTEPTKPVPDNSQPPNAGSQTNSSDGISELLRSLDIPFLDIFKRDGDSVLILGLLLILISEKADKKLLFALIYILL